MLSDLTQGAEGVVVVRPESIVLHQKKPVARRKPLEGRSARRCSWANTLSAQWKSAGTSCRRINTHSVQVRRGDPVWVELPAGECMALPAEE